MVSGNKALYISTYLTTHRTTMKYQEEELIYLDGMWLKEENLIKLAIGVGNFALAEHYLCAYLAHAVIFGNDEAVEQVNKVREYYKVPLIPLPKSTGEKGSVYERKSYGLDDTARFMFLKMPPDRRRAVLKDSMTYLRLNYDLFKFARHWLSVYLVVRDRLVGESLTQSNFEDYANGITPDDWPDKLRCTENTAKNFSRELDVKDRGEAYYDMKNNPQEELCKVFWEIVRQMIMTAG